MSDFWAPFETHKARIEHPCIECRGVIEIGEVYHSQFSIQEGEPMNMKWCSDCNDLCVELIADDNIDTDDWPGLDALCDEEPYLSRWKEIRANRRHWSIRKEPSA